MRKSFVAWLVLGACGGSGAAGQDAPVDTKVDAPLDAPSILVDAPPPPPGHHHYVLDSISVPTSNNEARDDGQDLNGDAVVDNQFGAVLGTLAAQGFPVQPETTRGIDRGATITLADVASTDLTTDPAATFAAFVGANPMPAACTSASDLTCRHHLGGNATFTIPPAAPTNPPIAGAFTAGAFATTTAGHLTLALSLFPDAAPVVLNLIGARVQLMSVSATKIMSAKLAGAITQAEISAKLYPAMRESFQAAVARDCSALTSPPVCGCTAGSNGRNWLALFDTGATQDCAISIAEISGNSLIQSLFAPDVTIENQQALSFGVRATAVQAGFVTP